MKGTAVCQEASKLCTGNFRCQARNRGSNRFQRQQAEMSHEHSEEGLCGATMLSLQQAEGQILEEMNTEEWLAQSAREAKHCLARALSKFIQIVKGRALQFHTFTLSRAIQ